MTKTIRAPISSETTEADMTEIRNAAGNLRDKADQWRRNSDLPGYPRERGAEIVAEAVYRADRAIRKATIPCHVAHDSSGWRTVLAFYWFRNLTRYLIAGNGEADDRTGGMDFETWRERNPDSFFFGSEVMEALNRIVEWLHI